MAEALWTDVASAYDRSFATLCTGTADALLADVPAGSRVLDVGCGSGHVAESLVRAGHVVHAVDPDPEMVALATSRSAADVRRGGLPDLPYEAPRSTRWWPTSCSTTSTTRWPRRAG